jgi:hypothetical protein
LLLSITGRFTLPIKDWSSKAHENSTQSYDCIRNVTRHNNGVLTQKDKDKDTVLQLPTDMTTFRIVLKAKEYANNKKRIP